MVEWRGGLDLVAADIARFWSKVDKSDGSCWLWSAATTHAGYGRFKAKGTMRVAHRVAYEITIGAIPDGLQLDHLCRNTRCVRPDHLEPVTAKENQRRGTSPLSLQANQTHCMRGHPLSGDNLHIKPNGHRLCWSCHKKRQAVIRQKPDQKAKHAKRERLYRQRKKERKMSKAIRQGDVLVVQIKEIPVSELVRVEPENGRLILAYGESTGHSHSLALSNRATLFRDDAAGGRLYVQADAAVLLEHQEHTALTISPGNYAVRIQRTVQSGLARRVAD